MTCEFCGESKVYAQEVQTIIGLNINTCIMCRRKMDNIIRKATRDLRAKINSMLIKDSQLESVD